MSKPSPFRYFRTSPEIIRLAAMLYAPFHLLPRNIDDLLHEHAIEVSHGMVRFCWLGSARLFGGRSRKERTRVGTAKSVA